MDGHNLISVNIANFVTITIMAFAGLFLAGAAVKALKQHQANTASV